MNNSVVRGFLKAIIIVGVVFAIVYFLSYNKWLHHDFDSVDITYREDEGQKKDDNKGEESTTEYKELYNSINYEFLEYYFGDEFYDIYYNNKPLSEEYFIYVGIVNIIKNDATANCNYETIIDSAKLKDKINSLFGNVSYTDKSFTTKNGYLTIEYNSSSNSYRVKLNGVCSGFDYSNGGIKNVFVKSVKEGDNLYLYENAFYLNYSKDVSGNIMFNYHKDIFSDSKVIANNFEKLDLSSVPTYIFKFVKSNNVYTLQSITRK